MISLSKWANQDEEDSSGRELLLCAAVDGNPLDILPLRISFQKPPAGRGNVRALDENVRKQFAAEVLAWIAKFERAKGLKVRRIAIDAPSDICRDASGW